MTAAAPRVSIVMPAFNAAEYISAAIESVLAQTETRWELLVIDDGSTDATARTVALHALHDPRIELLRRPNRGVAAARNAALGRARGELVALLDADDLWAPDKLERHSRHLAERPEVGVSFSRARFIRADGRPTTTVSRAVTGKVSPERLFYGNPTTTCSTIVARRQVFEDTGGFDERLRHAEDLDWLLRVAFATRWRIAGIRAALTSYRVAEGGLSSQLLAMQEGWEALMRNARGYAPEQVGRHYASAKAAHNYYLARRALRIGAPALGRRLMREAIASDWRLAAREPARTLAVSVALWLPRPWRRPQTTLR